jgi:hypothetical protein
VIFSALLFLRPLFDPKKELNEYKPFVKYFELEPGQNVVQILNELKDTLPLASIRNVLLTPLIMDFDTGASLSKLTAQIGRLKEAIKNNHIPNLKILPFIGFDPRVRNPDPFLDQYDVKSIKERGGYAQAANGDFIGIKLYPPLGFPVYPKDFAQQNAFLAAYQTFARRHLPVTVHCQETSFQLINKQDTRDFTDPANWVKVFDRLNPSEQDNFKINFAHFGGEEGVKKMIVFRKESGPGSQTNPYTWDGAFNESWTRTIVRLLKKYKNTYSDLSAFNYFDTEALAGLYCILHADYAGRFDSDGDYRLVDKLLWGSDYPMVLYQNQKNFQEIYAAFIKAFTPDNPDLGKYEYPEIKNHLPHAEFIKKLTCDNPKKFLID